jgi:hypothetical protein
MWLGKQRDFTGTLFAINEEERYWLLLGMYRAMEKAADIARTNETTYWKTAAAEKRIKTRIRRESGGYRFTKVWVESAVAKGLE